MRRAIAGGAGGEEEEAECGVDGRAGPPSLTSTLTSTLTHLHLHLHPHSPPPSPPHSLTSTLTSTLTHLHPHTQELQQAKDERLVLRVAKCKSGYLGVHKQGPYYLARVKKERLGSYANAEAAALTVAQFGVQLTSHSLHLFLRF